MFAKNLVGGPVARASLTALGVLVAFALLLSACGDDDVEPKGDLLLGATTSVQDSGLLDELVEEFEDEYGYDVKPIVQGSGQIMQLASRGELDIIITHSPGAEQQLIDDGFGLDRTPVMQNYFAIVGPEDDPARIAFFAFSAMPDAFRAIAESQSTFVSRGDGSGTNVRELAIWEDAGIVPEGNSWYRESGTGQGQTLSLANNEGAYTLVDTSTFTTFAEDLDIVELLRDTEEPNIYSVVRLNPLQLSDVNAEAGEAWFAFMTGESGQRVIAEYGREEYGEPLFEPLLLN